MEFITCPVGERRSRVPKAACIKKCRDFSCSREECIGCTAWATEEDYNNMPWLRDLKTKMQKTKEERVKEETDAVLKLLPLLAVDRAQAAVLLEEQSMPVLAKVARKYGIKKIVGKSKNLLVNQILVEVGKEVQ